MDLVNKLKQKGNIMYYFYHPVCRVNGNVHQETQDHTSWIDLFQEQLPRKTKVLDLGAGTGYLMALLKLVNLSPYGVEVNPIVANIANKKLETFFKEETPLVSVGNYFDPNFPNLQFRDGTKVSYFDAFICRSYNSAHSFDILCNVLARPEIKIGSIAGFENVPSVLGVDKRLDNLSRIIYCNSGWIPISKTNGVSYRKTHEALFSKRDIDEFNELLFSCHDLWGESYKRDDTFDLAPYIDCTREKQPEPKPKSPQERLEDHRNAPAF